MNRGAHGLTAILILGMLPGCNPLAWMKEKVGGASAAGSGSGAAVVTFGSRTVLTESEFKKQLDTIFNSQPGVEGMVKQLPREQQLKIYEDLSEERLIKLLIHEYVNEKGLNKTSEYKDNAREAHKTLDGDLDLYAFQQELLKEARERVKKMNDEEISKYYTEHRNEPAFQREPFMKKDSKEFAAVDAVRPQLVGMLEGVEFQKLCNERVTELRTRLDAKVNKDFLAKLVPADRAGQSAMSMDSADAGVATTATPNATLVPAQGSAPKAV